MAPPRENRFRSIDRAGIGRDLDREITRKTFFGGDDRIPKSRLDRRKIQDDLENQFRKENLKDVETTSGGIVTGLTQKKDPLGQEFADYRAQVAFKYGPTVGEIAADFGRATGDILEAAATKFGQGKLGLFGIINATAEKFNKDYDKLNDVQKEIFENPDKYPNASNIPVIQTQNNSRQLLVDADKAVLGLESTAQDAKGIPAIGSGSGFNEQPSDLFGAGQTTLPPPKISIETSPDLTQKELSLAEGLGFLDPRYIEQQKELLRELNISPQVAELLDANEPGGRGSNQGEFMFPEGYTIPGTNITIPSIMRQGEEAVTGGEGFLPEGFTRDEEGRMILEDAQSSVTEFNNPVNLMDVGQAGTTGETYGNGFAIFPDAQTGIMAAKNDLAIKTERYGGNVDEIIGEFSPRVDNPDSFDNYVNFVKQGVGDTVDPGEEDELLRRVIQFENKPDIAQQYLALVAEGGLMDKKMYGGIIASKG
jgi:hypothetical protein